MRDAFLPPIVVCGDLFTRFVWVDDIVWQIACRRLVLFEWIAWKNITEMGRGGAYVPARMCGLFMEVGRGGACVPARVAP